LIKAILIVSALLIVLDLYVFRGLYHFVDVDQKSLRKAYIIGYWTISVIVILSMIVMIIYFNLIRTEHPIFWLVFASVFSILFIPKVIFSGFLLVDDLFNAIGYGYTKLASSGTDWERRRFITKIGLGISAFMVGAFAYGVTKGKYAFRVLSNEVSSKKIPPAFDGLRIVQLSDAHLGSFVRDYEPIERMVAMVNRLNPDLILFTGDMVNEHAQEAEGWEPVFAALKAKHGKYSVFGNHDYAHYGPWNEEERADSVARLKKVHAAMGFRLMQDENEKLNIGGEFITLVGVHNWGKGFGEIGDLKKAMIGVDQDSFQVLLSHDPTHFEYQVQGKTNIDLTLSGHTHGMQMGLEIPALGIKLSPISFRYKRWAGLYQEGEQFIHVNRGMGVLGFPGRVGMAPEVTLIELKRLG
jgi:hypothetical protein